MSKLLALITPQLVVGLLAGGLAGSIFTWIVNRPEPTVVTYNFATTALEEAQAASIIPNLRIQIGNERIKAVYVHVIKFEAKTGPYLETFRLAITFPATFRIFGKEPKPPSPEHRMNCEDIKSGVRCTVAPMMVGSSNNYQLTLATDQKGKPDIVTTANNVRLLEENEYESRRSWALFLTSDPLRLSLLAAAIGIYLTLGPFLIHVMRRVRRVHPGLAEVILIIADMEAKLPFVSVKYLNEKVFGLIPRRQKDLQFALRNGMLEVYSLENPNNPSRTTSACRLNRDHPLVKLVLLKP